MKKIIDKFLSIYTKNLTYYVRDELFSYYKIYAFTINGVCVARITFGKNNILLLSRTLYEDMCRITGVDMELDENGRVDITYDHISYYAEYMFDLIKIDIDRYLNLNIKNSNKKPFIGAFLSHIDNEFEVNVESDYVDSQMLKHKTINRMMINNDDQSLVDTFKSH